MRFVRMVVVSSLCFAIGGVGAPASAGLIDFEDFADGDVLSEDSFVDVVFSRGANPLIVASTTVGTVELGPEFMPGLVVRGSTFTSPDPFRADLLRPGVRRVDVVLGDIGADADMLFLLAFRDDVVVASDSVMLPAGVSGGFTLSVAADQIDFVQFGSEGDFANSVFFDDFRTVPEPAGVWLLLAVGSIASLRRRRT